jgi:hypothetical protein
VGWLNGGSMNRIGFYVFAIANIAMGLLNLIWGSFDPVHQPIQAFGDNIPGIHVYAYLRERCSLRVELACSSHATHASARSCWPSSI